MIAFRRKFMRLKNYDYSKEGKYFVTICTQGEMNYFGQYPKLKEIVMDQWVSLPERFKNINVDEYIVMPNHIHGIITVGAAFTAAKLVETLGQIIGAYKSLCVGEWIKYIKKNKLNISGKFWQRSYYEHVVRDNEELMRIRKYIINNPFHGKDEDEMFG